MMMMVVTVFVCVLVSSASALYSAGGPVTVLTKQNFASEVIMSDTPYIVEFFAPWCGHCKQLAPTYKEVASKVGDLIGVGAIDCDQERELCGAFGIKGFPTIKVFGSQRVKKDGHPWKEPIDYNGQRSTGAIGNAGLAQLHDKDIRTVVKAGNGNLAAVLNKAKDGAKSVLLFSQKSESSNLFKALSMQYSSRGLQFVLVPAKDNEEVAKQYDVKSMPSLFLVDGEKRETFSGKFGAQELRKFLEKYAQPKQQQQQQQQQGKEAPPKETPKPVEYDQVMEEVATTEKWDSKCASKSGLCGVAFLDPEDGEDRQKKFVGVLEELLTKVYRNVKIMWVNGPQHYKFFEKFRLGGGFPNFAVYTPSKKRVVPYKGALVLDDLKEWVDKVLLGSRPSYEVENLTFE